VEIAKCKLALAMNLQAEAGRGLRYGKGKGKGKGRAACQLVDTIDMWDFGIGSLRMSCFGVQKGAAGVLELGFGVDWRGGVPHVDVPQARVLFGFIPACGSYLAQAVLEDRYCGWAAGEGVEGTEGREVLHRENQRRGRCSFQSAARPVEQSPEIKSPLQTQRSTFKQ
jgi:hypothetical protein